MSVNALFGLLLFPVSDTEYTCKQVPGRFVFAGTVPCCLTRNQHDWFVFMLLIRFSALFQSVFIPEDLYQRIYNSLKSFVTLPVPYCAIALNYARQMKMEQTAPGNLYRQLH